MGWLTKLNGTMVGLNTALLIYFTVKCLARFECE
jgi:hypothetical protein